MSHLRTHAYGTQRRGPVSLPDFAAVGWDDPFGIDTSVAHPARRYHYWLGGTDNFRADRVVKLTRRSRRAAISACHTPPPTSCPQMPLPSSKPRPDARSHAAENPYGSATRRRSPDFSRAWSWCRPESWHRPTGAAKFHSKNAPRQPTFAFSVPSPASTDTYGTERKDP